MRSNNDYGYDPSYKDLPTRYHVVIAIPRSDRRLLIQQQANGEFSLPMAHFEPNEISATAKALQMLRNFAFSVEAKDLRELSGDLWKPNFQDGRLVSVDVFLGFFVEGLDEKRALNPHLRFKEVTLDEAKSLPLVDLKVSEEEKSWEFGAQAQLLFDAFSVSAGPFYQEPETWQRVEELGFELSEDGFFPICKGAYLGNYRSKQNRYYYRLDPRKPDGRHVGPLDHLVGS